MNTRSFRVLFVAFLALSAVGIASAQLFTPGDIVVSTYGSVPDSGVSGNFESSATPGYAGANYDGVPTPITLMEYTTSGQFVLADTLPTSDSTVNGVTNYGIVGENGSSSEGALQLSGNGEYLTIGGYSATPAYAGSGTTNSDGQYGNSGSAGDALAQSPSADVPRIAAVIDATGNVNTSTALNGIYDQDNIRSVYTATGSNLYVSGQSGDTNNQGVYYTPTGTNTVTSGSTPTAIYTTNDTRFVTSYGGNLYFSQAHKKSAGIYMYTGNPTAGATPVQITPMSGTIGSTTVNFSPDGFFFASATVLYVADTGVPKAGGIGDGGIQKWVFSGGIWNLSYTITPSDFVSASQAATATSGETGFEAITGELIDGVEYIYAVSYTAGDANPNGLYAITDVLSDTMGSSSTITELEESGDNGTFKGVSFAPTATAIPEPSTYAAMIGVCALGLAFWRRCVRKG